jgi:Beta-lactamase enzyme family
LLMINRRQQLALSAALLCAPISRALAPTESLDLPPNSTWLHGGSANLKRWLADPAALQLQLCYTPMVNRIPQPTRYFRKDAHWFAAASLVKLPLAAFMLEQLEAQGLDFRDLNIAFPDMPACAERAPELRKPQPIARVLERALVQSDDSSYCALYDFLGPQFIEERFRALGDIGVRIQARFGFCGPEGSRVAAGFVLSKHGKTVLTRPALASRALTRAPVPIRVGKAWRSGSQLIQGAKDFSDSNTLPLSVAHRLLIALRYPNAMPASARFKLSEPARLELLRLLSTAPSQTRYLSPVEQKQQPHAFRLLGAGDGRWPAGLQITSKVGWAYGFLSDVAHLKDAAHECFISSACYLNADQVLNDGVYEYDSIGRPLMAELGRLLLRVKALHRVPAPHLCNTIESLRTYLEFFDL